MIAQDCIAVIVRIEGNGCLDGYMDGCEYMGVLCGTLGGDLRQWMDRGLVGLTRL